MEYNAYGCFSESHFRLEFHGGAPATVSIYKIDGTQRQRSERQLETLVVTAEELARVDRALSIYRADDSCVSSGYIELRISWFRDGRRKAREKLEGSWCRPYEGIELLHLGELIARAAGHDT